MGRSSRRNLAKGGGLQLPFVSAYDPPASQEGTLDPLGLYQIADHLAIELVPAVRERMQRIQFLTPIVVGAVVTEGLEPNPRHPNTPPFMVWEWLVVEAIIRSLRTEDPLWGLPGTRVARRAIEAYKCIDPRSYLKAPRIYGFHGVYKRLVVHLGLVDVDFAPRQPLANQLITSWARGRGFGRFGPDHRLVTKWRRAVERSLNADPLRTYPPGWSGADWEELAGLMSPDHAYQWEKKFLQELLHNTDSTPLGALPAIWRLQNGFGDEDYAEEQLHQRLRQEAPQYAPLLEAISAYEAFGRSLQDAFDLIRAQTSPSNTSGSRVTDLAQDAGFQACASRLTWQYAQAHLRLGEVSLSEQGAFQKRFERFGESMTPAELAPALCQHHEVIQRGKSATGKRPWFNRLDPERIFMRHNYRIERPAMRPDRYVHDFRGWPIRRFWSDLT